MDFPDIITTSQEKLFLPRLSLIFRRKHVRAFQHMCADQLACFFPCFLHRGGKTRAEIEMKRFEQGCSEMRVVFCLHPIPFVSLPKLLEHGNEVVPASFEPASR